MKEENVMFRHEYKYFVSAQQLILLRHRLSGLIPLDQHVGKNGFYTIRSVYFDDVENSCFYENENGTDPREKFRIRIYNGDSSIIHLELKCKRNGKCLKKSCRISFEQCRRIIEGNLFEASGEYHPLLNSFLIKCQTRLLKPVVIVEYDRIPYVYRNGNVRVTLDCNIRSSYETKKFLEKSIITRPVLMNNQHLMEVKWDEYLPDFIRNAAALKSLQWTSFSKYYICREKNMGVTYGGRV